MKQLIKKRWFVFLLGILLAIVVLLGIGVILYCNGYRITYPQQFETSWDAVSGFAAWFGVGVSILSAAASVAAIWFAVQVADKQNKIELFEKRYEIYNIAIGCQIFAKMLSNKSDVIKSFLAAFCRIPTDAQEKDATFVREQAALITLKTIQVAFLFKNRTILLYMKKVDEAIADLVTGQLNGKENLEEKKQEVIKLVNDKQFTQILNEMQRELNLN